MSFLLSGYYHKNIRDFLRFVIPPGQNVLLFQRSCVAGMNDLQPKRGVIVQPVGMEKNEGSYEIHEGFLLEGINGPFDYIVLCDIFGFCDDIGTFLSKLGGLCSKDTRVIVLNHRYFYTPFLKLAESLRLIRKGGHETMLSWRDIESYMSASGFQFVSETSSLLCPLFLLGLGPVINLIGRCLPFFDWAKLNHYSTFRPLPATPLDQKASLTVCLTCRDEKECIEPLVKAIPSLTEEQEILFVEGHSIDGTREEIERVQEQYPDRNIRVIGQPGKGQGDAIREGFTNAAGEIIILLESDMTSPPENIKYVYDCLRLRRAEFVEGSRFVYPLSFEAMPFINQVGNWFFSFIFGGLFRQHMTDVLSGIKAIHKSNFKKILSRWDQLGIKDPFGDFELLFGAMRLGLKAAEIPIHYWPRPYGKSKTRAFFHGWILLKMAMAAFRQFRR